MPPENFLDASTVTRSDVSSVGDHMARAVSLALAPKRALEELLFAEQ